MKRRLLLSGFLCFFLPLALLARPTEGPIRVLFLGHEAKHHPSGVYAPLLMQALGREAIWFDYVTSPAAAFDDAAFLDQFDAVLLYANHAEISPTQWTHLKDFV